MCLPKHLFKTRALRLYLPGLASFIQYSADFLRQIDYFATIEACKK